MPERWEALKTEARAEPRKTPLMYGSDRNAGALSSAEANANRAGLTNCRFTRHAISDLQRPEVDPGLVIFNPPYGTRIGDKGSLHALYGAAGSVLKARFSGWRVAFITPERSLAEAAKLPLTDISAPIPHGGLKIQIYQTGPLP